MFNRLGDDFSFPARVTCVRGSHVSVFTCLSELGRARWTWMRSSMTYSQAKAEMATFRSPSLSRK